MKDYQLGVVESRFADIIWENEPISSALLCKRCEELLGWKKSTTYTVLKRLCEKQIFENKNGTVSSLLSREDFYSARSKKIVEEEFDGSLPAFLAAFTKTKKLTESEIKELRDIIENHKEG